MEKIMEGPAGIMTGIQKISTDTVGKKYPKAAGRSGGRDIPSGCHNKGIRLLIEGKPVSIQQVL